MRGREFHSRVSPKGQITLPAAVRKELNIKPKDSVSIELEKGALRIKPEPRLRDFYQKLPPLDPSRTWKEIERIAHEDHAEHVVKEGLS